MYKQKYEYYKIIEDLLINSVDIDRFLSEVKLLINLRINNIEALEFIYDCLLLNNYKFDEEVTYD